MKKMEKLDKCLVERLREIVPLFLIASFSSLEGFSMKCLG